VRLKHWDWEPEKRRYRLRGVSRAQYFDGSFTIGPESVGAAAFLEAARIVRRWQRTREFGPSKPEHKP
jgi:hypothetical protein